MLIHIFMAPFLLRLSKFCLWNSKMEKYFKQVFFDIFDFDNFTDITMRPIGLNNCEYGQIDGWGERERERER